MLFAGDINTWYEFLFVALMWGLPFALLAAIPLIALARRTSRTPTKFILQMLAALIGAIIGSFLGSRLYWQAHNQAPAIVYFFGGVVIGGSCGIIAVSVLRWLASRLRNFSSLTRHAPNSDHSQDQSISDSRR